MISPWRVGALSTRGYQARGLGGQAAWVATLGSRYPALQAATPNGGYLCWLVLVTTPVVLLLVGIAVWPQVLCGHSTVQCTVATTTSVALGVVLLVAAIIVSQVSRHCITSCVCRSLVGLLQLFI